MGKLLQNLVQHIRMPSIEECIYEINSQAFFVIKLVIYICVFCNSSFDNTEHGSGSGILAALSQVMWPLTLALAN